LRFAPVRTWHFLSLCSIAPFRALARPPLIFFTDGRPLLFFPFCFPPYPSVAVSPFILLFARLFLPFVSNHSKRKSSPPSPNVDRPRRASRSNFLYGIDLAAATSPPNGSPSLSSSTAGPGFLLCRHVAEPYNVVPRDSNNAVRLLICPPPTLRSCLW